MTQFVVVDEGDPDKANDDQVFWQLSGEARVQQIVYGICPKGLEVEIGPRPLRRERNYSIVARGEVADLIPLKGAGHCEFIVDRDGLASGVAGCRVDSW